MENELLGGAVVYPQVTALKRRRVTQRINLLLSRKMRALLRHQSYSERDVYVWGDNTTHLNMNGILSLAMEVYATGRNYLLSQLFKPGVDYITPISDEIKRQIKERDIPLIAEFTAIKPNQPYFLHEDDLVIYFAIYEYTPYYVGIPEFPIPIASLRDLIDVRSPLYRFLPPA